MDNEYAKDLIIEQRFLCTYIGQKSKWIQEICDKFPEVMINFSDPAQKSDTVQLKGPKNEVEKCTKYMQKIVAHLVENSYCISVSIFKQFHKNVIGKVGVNIKMIHEKNNTKIGLPKKQRLAFQLRTVTPRPLSSQARGTTLRLPRAAFCPSRRNWQYRQA